MSKTDETAWDDEMPWRMTRQGKKVYVISENDLQFMKQSGRRVRAKCPLHSGRSGELHLSIYGKAEDMEEEDAWRAGWGYCHSGNCEKTVLVKEWNKKEALKLLGSNAVIGDPKHQIDSDAFERAEQWQIAELAGLNKLYPRMQAQLSHPKAQAYLAQRGLQETTELLANLGVGYIPPLSEWNGVLPVRQAGKIIHVNLKKWCDRVVFPYTTREDERGFLGRSLSLWEAGMDENDHKAILKEQEVLRYTKTYKGGYINKAALTRYKHVYLCEGPFDLIPVLSAGIDNALALAGVRIDVPAIPTNVRSVTLALDADLSKKGKALSRECENLGKEGILFDFLSPPNDDDLGKDWSERYRKAGLDGLTPLFANLDRCIACHTPIPNPVPEDQVDNPRYTLNYTDTGIPYCVVCRPVNDAVVSVL